MMVAGPMQKLADMDRSPRGAITSRITGTCRSRLDPVQPAVSRLYAMDAAEPTTGKLRSAAVRRQNADMARGMRMSFEPMSFSVTRYAYGRVAICQQPMQTTTH